MSLPDQPVTLSTSQVDELVRQLRDYRHEVAGHLTVIVGAVELARLKPEASQQYLKTIIDRCTLIKQELDKFSTKSTEALKKKGG